MSTNYYMLSQSKGFAEKYFHGEYELTDTPMFGYEIHIGKRSMGWKPLFQEHKHAYDSVEGLMAFIKNNSVVLYDEYGIILIETELKENLIDWGGNQNKRYYKFVPEGVKGTLFGNKEYLKEVNSGEKYDIVSPFNHKQYEKLMEPIERAFVDIKYWEDKDGYDFTNREFS